MTAGVTRCKRGDFCILGTVTEHTRDRQSLPCEVLPSSPGTTSGLRNSDPANTTRPGVRAEAFPPPFTPCTAPPSMASTLVHPSGCSPRPALARSPISTGSCGKTPLRPAFPWCQRGPHTRTLSGPRRGAVPVPRALPEEGVVEQLGPPPGRPKTPSGARVREGGGGGPAARPGGPGRSRARGGGKAAGVGPGVEPRAGGSG